MSEGINIIESRENNLEKMREKVKEAYSKSPIISGNVAYNGGYEIDEKEKDQIVSEMNEVLGALGIQGSDVEVDLERFIQQDNMVVVNNPHDFMDLLKIAYEVLENPADDHEGYIRKNWEHELEHATPLMGNKNVNILYGVEFVRMFGPLGRQDFFIPFVKGEGKVSLLEKVDSILAPKTATEEDAQHAKTLINKLKAQIQK